jgi:hypothetical protein
MARDTAGAGDERPIPASRARARFRKPMTAKAPLAARAEAQRGGASAPTSAGEGATDWAALRRRAMEAFPNVRARLGE